jgi:hypothetical protein
MLITVASIGAFGTKGRVGELKMQITQNKNGRGFNPSLSIRKGPNDKDGAGDRAG